VKHFACYQLAWIFEKTDENLDRLPFQADFAALFLKFARARVELEDPEPYQMRRHGGAGPMLSNGGRQ
jgi:hypothetical protein